MRNVLVVVDMQNDFVTGALGTLEAQAVVPRIVQKIETGGFDTVLFTLDTHRGNYLDTSEGKQLPIPHCILGTEGHHLVPALVPDALPDSCFFKSTFGSWKLATHLFKKEEKISEVEFVGVCTDICVVSNALLLKAFCPELSISVDASCCAGSTPENHKAALNVMRACQIHIKGEET